MTIDLVGLKPPREPIDWGGRVTVLFGHEFGQSLGHAVEMQGFQVGDWVREHGRPRAGGGGHSGRSPHRVRTSAAASRLFPGAVARWVRSGGRGH